MGQKIDRRKELERKTPKETPRKSTGFLCRFGNMDSSVCTVQQVRQPEGCFGCGNFRG